MKYAFVDLDETMIHSDTRSYCSEFDRAESTELSLDGEKYYSLYRNGAREFLSVLRNKCDKVFMLTIATQDYAEGMNEAFKLGFDKDQIYSRYDIRRSGFYLAKERPKLIPGAVFLFDNLDLYDNREKTMYLEPLGKLSYIKVPAFYGNGDLTPELIAELTKKID